MLALLVIIFGVLLVVILGIITTCSFYIGYKKVKEAHERGNQEAIPPTI